MVNGRIRLKSIIDIIWLEIVLNEIFERFLFVLCRLTEVTLSSQINPLQFHLHIWSNQSYIDELENCSHRYYHSEEISTDEIDFGKESELLPVAHKTQLL